MATGTTLDYETKTSYAVTVEVSDGKAANDNTEATPTVDATIAVTINVTDVDEPPPTPAAPTVAVAPQTSLAVSWTAPDNTGRPPITDYDVQYRKQGDTAWTAHDHTGTDTSTTLTGLEPGVTYEVQVLAKNVEGTSPWSDSGTGTPKNAPPFFNDPDNPGADTPLTATTRSVAENAAADSNVGAPVTATDANDDPLTYTLSGTDAAAFAIGSTTGQITVAQGAALDHETTPSYTVTVEVTDSKDADGNAEATPTVDATIAVTINVTDVNEPPPTPAAPTAAPAEINGHNTLSVTWIAQAVFGVPATTDYDVQYREQDETAWTAHDFTGAVPGTAIGGLNPGTVYEVQVLARNDEGDSPWSESGTGITGPAMLDVDREVSENAAPGDPVGAPVTATNTQGHTLVYAISNPPNQQQHGADKFTIDPATGQIRLAPGAALDHETVQRYYLRVEASHAVTGEGDSDHILNAVIDVTIDMIDVDEPPDAPGALTVTAASTTSLTVSWQAPNNTGRPAIIGYDVQYRVVGSEAAFTYAGHDGTGTTTTLSALIPNTIYEVRVRAHNDEGPSPWLAAGGRTKPQAENSQSPSNRPPKFGGPSATRSVAENTAAGSAVGAPVVATDPNNDALTYSLSGSDAFAIDAGTGQIEVKAGAVLDYETTQSYAVTVGVADGKDEDGDAETTPAVDAIIAVTIDVTDVDEPPAQPDAPTVARSSTAPKTKLDVSWTGPGHHRPPGHHRLRHPIPQAGRRGLDGPHPHRHDNRHHHRRSRARDHLRSAGAGQERRRRQPLVQRWNGNHRSGQPVPGLPRPGSDLRQLGARSGRERAGGDQRGHPGCGHRPGGRRAHLYPYRLRPVRHQCVHRTDHRGRQRQPRLRGHAILRRDRGRCRRQGRGRQRRSHPGCRCYHRSHHRRHRCR